MLTAVISTDTDDTFVLDLFTYERNGMVTVYEVTDNSKVELATVHWDDRVEVLLDWLDHREAMAGPDHQERG